MNNQEIIGITIITVIPFIFNIIMCIFAYHWYKNTKD